VDPLLSSAVPVYVAEQDLRLRGFSAAGLPAGVQLVDDRRVVDLVMADDTRALGCF
jgi:sulfur transfer complex TusBCD TusB component (DsrH family)